MKWLIPSKHLYFLFKDLYQFLFNFPMISKDFLEKIKESLQKKGAHIRCLHATELTREAFQKCRKMKRTEHRSIAISSRTSATGLPLGNFSCRPTQKQIKLFQIFRENHCRGAHVHKKNVSFLLTVKTNLWQKHKVFLKKYDGILFMRRGFWWKSISCSRSKMQKSKSLKKTTDWEAQQKQKIE